MKFGFVFLPEDDPGPPEGAAAVEAASAPLSYEVAAGGMVRRNRAGSLVPLTCRIRCHGSTESMR